MHCIWLVGYYNLLKNVSISILISCILIVCPEEGNSRELDRTKQISYSSV